MQTTTSSYQSQLAASMCRAQVNQTHHQQQQQPSNCTNMASFVARLMSLNAHELQCLHSDSELMRHLGETHLLMESRLRSVSLESKLLLQQQFSPQTNTTTTDYHYYSPATYYLQQQQQQQQQLLQLSAAAAANAAVNNHQQQQQQQHQANAVSFASALDLRTTPTGYHLRPSPQDLQMNLSPRHLHQHHTSVVDHHQNQRHLLSATRSSSSNSSCCSSSADGSSSASASSSGSSVTSNSTNQQHQHHHQQQQQVRQTSAKTSAPSATRSFNPKKVKLSEYHNNNNTATNHQQQQPPPLQSSTNTASPNKQQQQQQHHQQITTSSQSPSGITTLFGNITPSAEQQTDLNAQSKLRKVAAPKKYKGEFDEPTPVEVEQRQVALASANNYHGCLAPELRHLGECACVLGSEFHDKPVSAVLEMIDQWRRLPTEERVKAKWDVNDLPKDIPLSDIKKYEDLRREASKGRADFGGASKRKPLGIRGTRQFLLILYCLWGHPGREDIMQKEGYCPHCFAKIKKANEQSTLVRVVNHFNMKHRKGANPRLSPHRDITSIHQNHVTDSQQSSSDQQMAPTGSIKNNFNITNELLYQQKGNDQLFADLMLLATSSAAVVDASSTSTATSSTISRSSSCSPEVESGAEVSTNPTSTTSPATTPSPQQPPSSSSNSADCQPSST